MAGIVAQNRPTGVAAAELVRATQVFHAVFDIGFRIIQTLFRPAIAHHARRAKLDLH